MQVVLEEQKIWAKRRRNDGFGGCEICSREYWQTEIEGVECNYLIPIERDHIDGNRSNNEEKNIRQICRQCHSNTPTFNNRKRKSLIEV
jgi:hypothetical protein